VQAFYNLLSNQVEVPRYLEDEGSLPGVAGPAVFMRVAEGSPGARLTPTPYPQSYVLLPPAKLPWGRRILLLGGSAAFGEGAPFEQTVGQRLQRALQQKATSQRPLPVVLNLARPGWELTSVLALGRRVVAALDEPPLAVVLYSGNNEFLHPSLESLGWTPPEQLALYRLFERLLRRNRWLRPPRDFRPDQFRATSFGPMSPEQITQRIWQPNAGLQDCSHWPETRRIILDAYRRGIAAFDAELRQRGVPLFLVPPPINLSYFPGASQPQPATFAALGRVGYQTRALALATAIARGDQEELARLARAREAGPLAAYAEAQVLEEQGRHAKALAGYWRARQQMMGILSSLSTMSAIRRELLPGRTVDTRGWYTPGQPVRTQSLRLFRDSCHLTSEGHRRLSQQLERALTPLLNPHPDTPAPS